jgi:hypothetical protein
MITEATHLDGRLLAERRGDRTPDAIGQEAIRVAADLHRHVPEAVCQLVRSIPGSIEKAEAHGDLIVEGTVARLIAECLDCTPADLGRNCPEMPFSRNAPVDELRARQRHRLQLLIRKHVNARRKQQEFYARRRSEGRPVGSGGQAGR